MRSPEDERFEAMRPVLERAVRKVCPAWLAHRRDDIVQTAMVRILEMQRRGEGVAALGPSYLRRVAYTAMVDEIRRIRARPDIDMAVGVEVATAMCQQAPDPEARFAGTEAGQAIQACLGQLNAARRSAVTLYLLGHGVPEIARLLGWSAKKAENAVYRGLAALRACLHDRGFEP